ncbi:MAG: hypothetical protein E7637_07350 [Ruminococcaceae bacterium]|nr:hypothetical protein [Oscillospiraceae bacterium]
MKKYYDVILPTDPKELREYVTNCDRAFESALDDVVQKVAKTPDLRMLGLTGPTCSGKTTAAKKLTACLEAHGHRVHLISIDDFYYDTEYLRSRPRTDSDSAIDYDSESTIDISLLERTTESLLAGRPTKMPRFNFRIGQREDGLTVNPDGDDVFLFEGIQVLYPSVHKILQGGSYRSIYISPEYGIKICQKSFEPNEIRLMRRLVRDQLYRASNAEFTYYLWDSVRKNEEASIFPNLSSCHDFINSTMPYEIGMLKPFLEAMLPTVSKTNPHRKDAEALLEKIADIDPVPHEYITPTSLYKEFI